MKCPTTGRKEKKPNRVELPRFNPYNASMKIKVGDLVRPSADYVKSIRMERMIKQEDLVCGLVIGVETDFYSHSHYGFPLSRITVVWNGLIESWEPENYLEIFDV